MPLCAITSITDWLAWCFVPGIADHLAGCSTDVWHIYVHACLPYAFGTEVQTSTHWELALGRLWIWEWSSRNIDISSVQNMSLSYCPQYCFRTTQWSLETNLHITIQHSCSSHQLVQSCKVVFTLVNQTCAYCVKVTFPSLSIRCNPRARMIIDKKNHFMENDTVYFGAFVSYIFVFFCNNSRLTARRNSSLLRCLLNSNAVTYRSQEFIKYSLISQGLLL